MCSLISSFSRSFHILIRVSTLIFICSQLEYLYLRRSIRSRYCLVLT